MKKYRLISILTLWLVSSICAFAQEVLVTVIPTQQVLPPQVLLYLADPGKYFTITLKTFAAGVSNIKSLTFVIFPPAEYNSRLLGLTP